MFKQPQLTLAIVCAIAWFILLVIGCILKRISPKKNRIGNDATAFPEFLCYLGALIAAIVCVVYTWKAVQYPVAYGNDLNRPVQWSAGVGAVMFVVSWILVHVTRK